MLTPFGLHLTHKLGIEGNGIDMMSIMEAFIIKEIGLDSSKSGGNYIEQHKENSELYINDSGEIVSIQLLNIGYNYRIKISIFFQTYPIARNDTVPFWVTRNLLKLYIAWLD